MWGGLAGVSAGGSLTVTCDHRSGVALDLTLEGFTSAGAPPVDGTWAYTLVDGVGDFTFAAVLDVPGDDSESPATGPARTRWTAEGGRSDVLLTGAGLGDATLAWSQCWNAAMTMTWQADSLGLTDAIGAEIDCPYGSFGL